MASPFLISEFGNTINGLRSDTINSLENAFQNYKSEWQRMGNSSRERAEKEIQLEVIKYLKEKYNSDVIPMIGFQAQQWMSIKEGIIRQYLRSAGDEIERRLNASKKKYIKENYVKVAVRCNSKGGQTVETEDVIPWVDKITNLVNSPEHKKYLIKQRETVIRNLMNMIVFPVSVKDTVLHKEELGRGSEKKIEENRKSQYVSEIKFLEDSFNEGVFLPDSAKEMDDAYSHIIVTLNGIRYLTLDGQLIEEIEGRIKTNEANKMGKFTSGIRTFPHYDGVGFKRKVQSILDIPEVCRSVAAINLNGKIPEMSYRFNGSESVMRYSKNFPFTYEYLKEARQAAEDSLVSLIKDPYVDETGVAIRKLSERDKHTLINGVWVDMNERVSKAPVETQIKDSFADLIYTFYSPLGHNSMDYVNRRNEENKTKISVLNKRTGKRELISLPSQLILDYQVNEIWRPAFSSILL